MRNVELNALQAQTLQAVISEDGAQTFTVKWAGKLDTDTISTSSWSTEDSSLTIANEPYGVGKGRNKKDAQQRAARMALRKLQA